MKLKKVLKTAVPTVAFTAAMVGLGIAANEKANTNNTLTSTTTLVEEVSNESTTGSNLGVTLPTVDLTAVKSGVIDVYKSKESIMLETDVKSLLEQYITSLKINLADLTITTNTDNYTGNGALKGNYMLVYNVVDLAEENSKNIVINVHVVDNLPNLYISTNSDSGLKQIVVNKNVELKNKATKYLSLKYSNTDQTKDGSLT